MTEYTSGSQLQEQRYWLRDFFSLSVWAWLSYFVISGIILIGLNIIAIWDVIFTQTPVDEAGPLTDNLIRLQNTLATPTVMLFWVGVGAIVYTVIWLLENVVFIARTQVKESAYRRGGQQPHKQYWRSIITSNGLLLLSVLVWFVAFVLYLRFLLPSLAEIFQSGITGVGFIPRAAYILIAVLFNVLSIYVLLLMQRVLLLFWRLNRPHA